jgi:hypothetical protein
LMATAMPTYAWQLLESGKRKCRQVAHIEAAAGGATNDSL